MIESSQECPECGETLRACSEGLCCKKCDIWFPDVDENDGAMGCRTNFMAKTSSAAEQRNTEFQKQIRYHIRHCDHGIIWITINLPYKWCGYHIFNTNMYEFWYDNDNGDHVSCYFDIPETEFKEPEWMLRSELMNKDQLSILLTPMEFLDKSVVRWLRERKPHS